MVSLHNIPRLTPKQLDAKINFIQDYIKAPNAATASLFDPNSNVTNKNVATLTAELNKDYNIQVKRKLIYNKIEELFNTDIADKYITQLENHLIYAHDETATVLPYCAAVSIYPFLHKGLQSLGGESKAPQHLSSFNGGFINLIFALASMFAGAIATVEYLVCFDYFARKDYGDDYLDIGILQPPIKQEFQQVVYALNQPAASRGFQSAFWNISIFDKYYFNALFSNYMFPDGTKPKWETVNRLQKMFLHWFNEEREKALLTFPIVTVALLNDGKQILDKDYETFVSKELSQGNSFFIYTSNTVDSLSSCCRLRNDITDQINDFSYSLGTGGIMTGSVNVLTLNLNRFVQIVVNEQDKKELNLTNQILRITLSLHDQINLMHIYQYAIKQFFIELENNSLLPAYTNGFMDFDKQYVTIGINGLVESAEYLGIDISNNSQYLDYCSRIFSTISHINRENSEKYNMKINCELVPAENVGVKFANWDKKDNLFVPRDCYNSYLYRVEDNKLEVIDKFKLHGKSTLQYCDGGSALHVNLEEILSLEQYKQLLNVAVQEGCPYFCFNTKVTICNDCGYINKETKQHCTKCNSKDVDYGVRIIGYLKRISNFSKERQLEESKRHYHKC